MISVDLSKPDINSFFDPSDHEICEIFEMMSPHQDLLLFDQLESNRLIEDIPLTNLHLLLEKFKSNIYYVTGDFSFVQHYDEWHDKKSFTKKMQILTWPFGVDISRYEEFKPRHFYLNGRKNKTKNFIYTVSRPQLMRLITLDKFYQKKYFEYSFFPFFHLEDMAHFNEKYISIYEKIYLPYKWSEDQKSLMTGKDNDFDYMSLNCSLLINENVKLQNGFNTLKNIKELTELMHVSKKISNMSEEEIKKLSVYDVWKIHNDKFHFDTMLTNEAFDACCDMMFETYCISSVFFTEKTWKEISYRRPYLMFGYVNQYEILEKMGFEKYDEIFDYEFDKIHNTKDRWERYCEEIEKFIDTDPKDFSQEFKHIDEKTIYNEQLLQSYCDKSFLHETALNKHLKEVSLTLLDELITYSEDLNSRVFNEENIVY